MQEIIEIRRLIHVLPHEALIVRDLNGTMTVYSSHTSRKEDEEHNKTQGCYTNGADGVGTAFFLPPYSKIVRMSWSAFAAPGGAAQPARRLQVTWPSWENPHKPPPGRKLQQIP